jgi:hypothetical protein
MFMSLIFTRLFWGMESIARSFGEPITHGMTRIIGFMTISKIRTSADTMQYEDYFLFKSPELLTKCLEFELRAASVNLCPICILCRHSAGAGFLHWRREREIIPDGLSDEFHEYNGHPRIPTGFRPKAQGCEARATLGQHPQKFQPQRGCDHFVLITYAHQAQSATTTLWLSSFWNLNPR